MDIQIFRKIASIPAVCGARAAGAGAGASDARGARASKFKKILDFFYHKTE